MKTIINYFRKRKEERLRAKIALRTGCTVNDLQTVYEFIKNNGTPVKTTPNFRIAKEGEFSIKAKIDWDSILDNYFKNRKSTGFKADEGGMSFIDGSLRDNTKNLEIKESGV